MNDQNNTNNQNPINPLDQSQISENPKPIEEVVNINTQTIPDISMQDEKTKENENQNIDVQGFPQMDSSTPPPPPIPIVEENLSEEQGTNSPDLDIPSVISTDNKFNKKPNGKLIATILGIMMLLVGVGAGVVLLRQQQDVREKASEYPNCTLPNGVSAPCQPCDHDWTDDGVIGNCTDQAHKDKDGNVISCNPGWYLCTVDDPGVYSAACCKVGSGGTNPPSTNPPSSSPPVVSASCLDIKAYDTTWKALTLDELKELNAGETVRFTVSGTATSGTFSKAKFTINTVVKPETTTKKPDTNEFYIEYMIPENVTEFLIKAQIYHSTKGWI